MKQNAFYEMFVNQLRNLYDGENQLIDFIPKVIAASSNSEFKEAIEDYLEESKNQLARLKNVFKLLNENPTGSLSKGIRGLIEECQETIDLLSSSVVKDACLIICCQKINHYGIAAYGSARAIAHHLNHIGNNSVDFDAIADILQQNLDEEASLNELLTDIAEGGFFTDGINDDAEKEATRETSY